MNGQDPTRAQNVDPSDYVSAVKRTSWGAVFAGVVTAISVQLLLSLLGAAVGLTTMYAQSDEAEPTTRGMAVGAGIWWLLSSIVSLFVGGWVAGRLSGVIRPRDAGLHGIVVWGVSTVFAFYMATSTIGSFMGGAMAGAGAAIGQSGEGQQRIIGMPAGPATDTQGFYSQMERDVDQLLQSTQTQPGATQQPNRDRIIADIRANFRTGQQPNRDQLVNVLAQNNIPRAEAEQKADQWLHSWQQQSGGGSLSEAVRNIAQRPGEATEKTTKYLASASWWSFFALLFGAISAGVGGYVGTPQGTHHISGRTRSSGGVI